jgi:hypothetical protein
MSSDDKGPSATSQLVGYWKFERRPGRDHGR